MAESTTPKRTPTPSHPLKWFPLVTCNVIVLALASICYIAVFVEVDVNPCIMTYMYPNYLKIPTDDFPSKLGSKYELYLYKEGINVRNAILPLRGVPVLFMPGNAGTYKQVRSFGSEMSHLIQGDFAKLVDEKTGEKYANSLDFFAVHFQSEFSVLEGNVMIDQTKFVNDCIQFIIKLYSSSENLGHAPPGFQVPKSVILVGHSMGGVVARAVLTLPAYVHGSVTTIITLNTPHRIAPAYLHQSTFALYTNVNDWWVDQFKSTSVLDDVVVVSFCGGHRDTLVRSELASLEGLVPESHGLSMLTTSIPNTWLEADHLSILWCKQFVHAMLRAMLRNVDPSTQQNTLSRPTRLAHFTSSLISDAPVQLGLLHKNTTSPPLKNTEKFRAYASAIPTYDRPSFTHSTREQISVKFDIGQWTGNKLDHFVILTSISASLQVVLCTQEYEYADVSNSVISLPVTAQDRTPSPSALFHLSPAEMSEYKYILVTAPKQGSKSNFLIAQFYNPEVSTFSIPEVPLFSKTFRLSGDNILNKFVISSHHKHLPLTAHLSPSNTTELFLPMTYQFVNQPMVESKFVHNARSTKIKFHQSTLEPSYLVLLADPSKQLEVSIGLDWKGMIGQYSRAYVGALIGTLFSVFLFTFSRQIRVWRHSGAFPHFLVALRDHFNIIGIIIFAATFVGSQVLKRGPNSGFLLPDPFLDSFLHEHTTPYWVFPFVYMSAVAVISVLAIVTWLLLNVLSSLYRLVPFFSGTWIAYPLSILMFFAHSSIPLALATLTLPLLSQHSIPARQTPSAQSTSASTLHYLHSLFIMFVLIITLTAGSLVLWVHNLLGKFISLGLFLDGYEVIGALVLVLYAFSSRAMLPRKGLPLDTIVFVAGFYCLEYSQLLSYRAMYSMYFVVTAMILSYVFSLKEKTS